jgi:hypothetical protein
MRGTDRRAAIWPLSLEKIEAAVAAHLGPGRVAGNKEEQCFSRQVSMYLAEHVGGWSTPRIGKFYNGRHHTTVLHAIRKVEKLRSADDSIDALVEMLTSSLNPRIGAPAQESVHPKWLAIMIEAVAARVLGQLGRSIPRADIRADPFDQPPG